MYVVGTSANLQLSVYTQAQGQLRVYTFRTPTFVSLMEEMIRLRATICGNLPAVAIEGPPVKWNRTKEKFKPTHKTQHFCGTFCNTLSLLTIKKPTTVGVITEAPNGTLLSLCLFSGWSEETREN
jgi:hypothetical protein